MSVNNNNKKYIENLPIRVLVFGASGTILGGIEMFLLNMNEFMDNCIFDYVILGDECIHEERINQNGGYVYRVTSYRRNPIKYIIDTIRVLKNYKINGHIAYFNLFSMCHITSVILARVFGYKVFLHSHNNNVANKSSIYKALHRFNRFLLKRRKYMRLTNSPESGKFMFDRDDSIMIYNAIDADVFRFSFEKRNELRVQLGVNDKTVYGFVGRLATQKNPLFLLDIFEKIQKIQDDAVLLIVGEGNLRGEVENKIMLLRLQDKVILLGSRLDVPALYQAMDVLILPSLFEGLGIVLVEAQSSGLPCITSAYVVPKFAQISNKYLTFVPLSEAPDVWANKALSMVNIAFDRTEWNETVKDSKFNIEKEAKRLQKTLINL